MKPKVKFCGMTRSEDILAAENLCVDFIGLIFVPSSPRSVTLTEAKELRRSIKKAKCVGVFGDDHSIDEIEEHIRELRLDYVQMHGIPDAKKAKSISVPVIQAFRGVPAKKIAETFLKMCPYILIDKAENEDEADFDAIAAFPSHLRSKIFLAGGLTPENVGPLSEKIQPFAVDAARGIENRPGIKDHRLMSSFFHALP